MIKQLQIIFLLISYSALYSQKNDVEINKQYLKIENSKSLIIDSLSLTRGIDFSNGDNADEKKYKIFKKGKKIVKIDYEEINNGYRKWNKKTTIYLKNDIPFFIMERINGEVTLYLIDGGEKSEPHKVIEEIYVYDWNIEKVKRVYNGYEITNQMKICKLCYEELIEQTKLRFNSK